MEKTITDLQLKAQKAILDEPRTKEHAIEALEENGIITLKGTVPSSKVGDIAKKIVEDVPGVTGAINTLEVRGKEQGKII
jgi:osmotically-inducible protein OsmY